MAAPDSEPKFVDPLPEEYLESIDCFRREVIDRASEIPPDELQRLMDAEWERRWPYMRMDTKATLEHIAAMLGIDPEEFKKPPEAEGCLAKYFGPDCDSLEMVRAVRGRGSWP